MNTEILLAEGLEKGFGGSTNIEKVERGGFQLTSSHYEGEDGTYHDEWVNGGGQELARNIEGEAMTRVYCGGVISDEKLSGLGITEKDVMTFLKKVLTENSMDTRLDMDFKTGFENWWYTYRTLYMKKDPSVISAIEEIYYKDNLVFVHTFGISPANL